MWIWELIIKYSGIILSAGLGGFIGSITMEKLKSYWEKKNKEHEVVFTKFHEKQSIVLAELFSKMSVMERSVKFCLNKASTEDEMNIEEPMKGAMNAIADFICFYNDNEIFVSDKIKVRIDSIRLIIETTFNKAVPYISSIVDINSMENPTDNQLKRYFDMIQNVKKFKEEFTIDFPNLRQELRKEIKSILSALVK